MRVLVGDRRPTAGLRRAAIAAAMGLAATGAALALEPAKTEATDLKACARKLCDIVLSRSGKGSDYSCALAKTWTQSTIESGAKKSSMTWAFGDARCNVDVTLARTLIVGAVGQPTFALEAPAHAITCQVERSGEIKPVTAVVAPRIEFREGKAEKVWIGLKSVEGPGEIKALVKTLSKLHDKVGLFHGGTVKSINKLLHKTCHAMPGAPAKSGK